MHSNGFHLYFFYKALFHAVENNQVEIARLLLNNGAQYDITNMAGYTPLQLAKFNNFDDIIDLFPDDSDYSVPTEYFSNDHYLDLAPTAFDYDQK